MRHRKRNDPPTARFIVTPQLSAVDRRLFLVSIFTFLIFRHSERQPGLPPRRARGYAIYDRLPSRARGASTARSDIQYLDRRRKKVFTGSGGLLRAADQRERDRAWSAATMSSAIGARIVWLLGRSALGLLSALRPGSATDRVLALFSLTAISTPVFVLGAIALYAPHIQRWCCRTGGYVGITSSPWQWGLHISLPWSCPSLISSALFTASCARIFSTRCRRITCTWRARRASALARLLGHVPRILAHPDRRARARLRRSDLAAGRF